MRAGKWTCFLTALVAGCSESTPTAPERAQPAARPAALTFDASKTGTIVGRVTWSLDIPEVPPFEVRANLPHDHPGKTRPVYANPNAPKIDKTTGGVAGAIVFLRGVDSKAARPWDHPPVRIEQRRNDEVQTSFLLQSVNGLAPDR